MKKTVSSILFLSVVSMPATALLIDDFSTEQNDPLLSVLGSGDPSSAASAATGEGILGGERELFVKVKQSNPMSASSSFFVEGGQLFVGNDNQIITTKAVTWDGSADEGASPIIPDIEPDPLTGYDNLPIVESGVDTGGLGSIDFTGEGLYDTLFLDISFTDVGFLFYINTWWNEGSESNSALFVSDEQPINEPQVAFTALFDLGLSEFGETDWTNISAFQIVVEGANLEGGLDATVDKIGLTGNKTAIPEPATLGIFGLALAGMGIMHRRRINIAE